MNTRTQQLTYGAMITALFGMLLLLNRQTGGFMEEMLVYVFPIPMAAYTAKFGGRPGLPVLASMSLIAFLCGTFTSVFYAISQACVGAVLGTRLFHKKDLTRTLLLVMFLSALSSILTTIVLASLFGYDLKAEMLEFQNMMTKMAEQTGMVIPEDFFSTQALMRLFIISALFMGAVQGYIVYVLSLLVLRRLRYPVPQPKPLSAYQPPAWSGWLGLAGLIIYQVTFVNPLENEILQSALQTVGLLGYLYLICFGFIAVLQLFRTLMPNHRKLAVIPAFLFLMMFSLPVMILGVFYITGHLKRLMDQAGSGQGGSPGGT